MVGIFHATSTGTTTKIFVTDFDATHVVDNATFTAAHLATNTITASVMATGTITTAILATNSITTTTLAASSVTGSKIDSATVALANLTTSAYPVVIFESGSEAGISAPATSYLTFAKFGGSGVESNRQIIIPFAWAVTGLSVLVLTNTANGTTDIILRATSTDVSGTTTSIASSVTGRFITTGISTNITSSSLLSIEVGVNGSAGVFVPDAVLVFGIRT